MVLHTKEQITTAIKNLVTLSTNDIAHQFKCAHSKQNKLYKPFLDACERELNKRKRQTSVDEPTDEQDEPEATS